LGKLNVNKYTQEISCYPKEDYDDNDINNDDDDDISIIGTEICLTYLQVRPVSDFESSKIQASGTPSDELEWILLQDYDFVLVSLHWLGLQNCSVNA